MKKKRGSAVRIRPVVRLEDLKKLLIVFRRVFRYEDLDLTPLHELSITSRMGALILGAFSNRQLIGFVYSFPAVFERELVQHSHVLAVVPEHEGRGVGKKLKLAQRNRALSLGYRKITWTFDPLKAKNANFNLHSLGSLSRIYLRNLYGTDSRLCLGPRIPTDRLFVEWQIGEKADVHSCSKKMSPSDLAEAPRALEARAGDGDPLPGPVRLGLKSESVLAEVPCDINAWRSQPRLIAAWQKALRRVLEHYFKRDYAVVDFVSGDHCFYVLTISRGRTGRSARLP